MIPFSERENLNRILSLLKLHRKGLTITEISKKIKINRNSVAKYLEILLLSGRVEMATVGVAKVFSISHRVPISAMLSFSSGIIVVLNDEGRLIQTNKNFTDFFHVAEESAVGSLIRELPVPCLSRIGEDLFNTGKIPEDEFSLEVTHEVNGEPRFLMAKVLPTVFEDGGRGVTLIMEDISERKRAEIALKESEEKFRNVAELSSFPVAVIDSDGRYIYVNKKFTETFGYTGEEIKDGGVWFRLAYPDPEYRRAARQAWKEDLAHSCVGEVRPRIFSVTCRDGTKKEICFRPITMPDGNQLITYEDITEKQAIERQLQFLSSILDNSKKAIVGLDKDGKILTWNRGVERMTGLSSDEMLGRTLLHLSAPGAIASCEDVLHVVSEGRSVETHETTWIHRDGHPIDVSLNCSPILDRNRCVRGILVIMNDITNEKRAEKDLRMREYIITAMGTGIGMLDHDWSIRYMNHPLLDLFKGAGGADLIGRSFAELVYRETGNERFLDGIREAIRKDGYWEGKISFDLNRGAPLLCHMTARQIDDHEAAYVMISVEDIEKKKEAEQVTGLRGSEIEEVIEFLPDPTLMINADGVVCGWNQAMEQLTGIKRVEMIGKRDYEYAVPFYGERRPMLLNLIEKPDSEIIKFYPNFRRFGKDLHTEVFMPGVKGKGAYFWVKASPIYNESKRIIGAIESLMDITYWKGMKKVGPLINT